MDTKYQIEVFGKKGCDKCMVLVDRLSKILANPEYKDFSTKYWDVETEEGMVRFCEMECLNPQRLPAMVVNKKNEKGEYEPVSNRNKGTTDALSERSRLYQYLGLQTDYSENGKGVITPSMIKAILDEAMR